MTRVLHSVARALPTLFGWHAVCATAAFVAARPVIAALGDSRWYADDGSPDRIELAALAATLQDVPVRLAALAPVAAAFAAASLLVAPLATATCHRALAQAGRPVAHLRWALTHARAVYAVAIAAALAHVLSLGSCAALAWMWTRRSGDMSAPAGDLGLLAAATLALGGWLLVKTVHDLAMAALAHGASQTPRPTVAVATALRAGPVRAVGAHLLSWLAVAGVWFAALMTGFAILGPAPAAAALAPAWHQCLALFAAAVRWCWLAHAGLGARQARDLPHPRGAGTLRSCVGTSSAASSSSA